MAPARMLKLCPLALLLVVLGCQNRPAALTAVSGKVLYRGGLVPSGLIVFTPDAEHGSSGAIAFGKIRQDGSYTLFTGESEGATAGWYRISVAALNQAAVTMLPEKYRDPSLSLLTCEVKPDKVNHFDFNLD
jgi:hypothetical protein